MYYLVLVFKLGFGATAVVMPSAYVDLASCVEAVKPIEDSVATWVCVESGRR